MNIAPQKIKQFQTKILDWYEVNKRDLPWREVPSRNHSVQDRGVPNGTAPFDTSLQQRAYVVLVSEVMSQQTQISRVVPKFQAWMKELPTVQSLANAPVAEVLRLWSGLGYNRRALNLKKTAEIIVKQYGGKFPQDEKELLKLPGIGQYTARALLCFAFDQQIAVVDTNVRRVILTQVFKNSKFEVRNSKQIQNKNDKNKKRFDNFNLENLEIVSSFDIRYSDLTEKEHKILLISYCQKAGRMTGIRR